MYRKLIIALPLFMLAGCGGSGSSSSAPAVSSAQGVAVVAGNTTDALTISSKLSGSVSGTTSSLKAGSTGPDAQLYGNLARILAQRHISTLSNATYSSACTGGGSIIITYPDTQTGSSATITGDYTYCDDGSGSVMNGTVTISATTSTNGSTTYTMTMGNGDTSIDASDLTVTDTATGNVSTYSFSVSGTDDSLGNPVNISMNGIMNEVYTGGSETVTAKSFTMSWSSTSTQNSITMNGSLSYLDTDTTVNPNTTEGMAATFTKLTQATNISDGSYTLDGGMSVTSTPASCADGSVTFTTISPIFVDASGNPISGTIQINDYTVEYLSNGDIQVTDSQGVITTYTAADFAVQACPAS